MSTAICTPDPGPPVRLLTVADLSSFPSELPSGSVLYELDNGKLIVFPVHDAFHGAVEANLATELMLQGERRGLGKARVGGVGVVLWRGPDRVVGADALFIANASLPVRLSSEGFLETIPDLVVEVRDRNESQIWLRRKVKDYLVAGVRVVWVADPEARAVTVYRRGQPPHEFRQTETLTVEDVIPGFEVAVGDLFPL
jgi:Uma2 family endonuclease